MRKNIRGTSPFESVIGFSRAVLIDKQVHVSGTGPVGADDADAGTQMRQALQLVEKALVSAGATFEDVVRTRMYLTHVEDWEAVGRVHGEVFGNIQPAATMVVVAKLLHPAWRIEIEADAVLPATKTDSTPITRERIRRIEKKALDKLRSPSANVS